MKKLIFIIVSLILNISFNNKCAQPFNPRVIQTIPVIPKAVFSPEDPYSRLPQYLASYAEYNKIQRAAARILEDNLKIRNLTSEQKNKLISDYKSIIKAARLKYIDSYYAYNAHNPADRIRKFTFKQSNLEPESDDYQSSNEEDDNEETLSSKDLLSISTSQKREECKTQDNPPGWILASPVYAPMEILDEDEDFNIPTPSSVYMSTSSKSENQEYNVQEDKNAPGWILASPDYASMEISPDDEEFHFVSPQNAMEIL